jgi:hypothetical protein
MNKAIKRLNAMLGVATPRGEDWGYFQHLDRSSWFIGKNKFIYRKGEGAIAEVFSRGDAHLIAASRNLLPELLALWEGVQKMDDEAEHLCPPVFDALAALNARAAEVLGGIYEQP